MRHDPKQPGKERERQPTPITEEVRLPDRSQHDAWYVPASEVLEDLKKSWQAKQEVWDKEGNHNASILAEKALSLLDGLRFLVNEHAILNIIQKDTVDWMLRGLAQQSDL